MKKQLSLGTPKDHWCTPTEVLEVVEAVGPIHLDPCSNAASIVPAKYRYDGRSRDGLTEEWEVPLEALAYVNPPTSKDSLDHWLNKCVYESSKGHQVIALVPAGTGTSWWHRHVPYASAICFWAGALKMVFEGKPTRGGYYAAIYYGAYPWAFESAFDGKGWMVRRSWQSEILLPSSGSIGTGQNSKPPCPGTSE